MKKIAIVTDDNSGITPEEAKQLGIYIIKMPVLIDGTEYYEYDNLTSEQFYKFLTNFKIKKTVTFDDHHRYNEDDLPEGIIVTTEKDAVKLKDFNRSDIYALKLKTTIDIAKLLGAPKN